jgi:hypothetical protein
MRHAGVFIVGCLITGLVASTGCGGGGGSTTTGSGANGTTTRSSPSGSGAGNTGGTGTGATATGGTGGGDTAVVGIFCNPVTNAGCTGGASCDFSQDNTGATVGFTCTPPPASVALCGDCSFDNCGPATTCYSPDGVQTLCARYCCSDADCGSGGMCKTTDDKGAALYGPVAPMIGVCVVAGAGDAGTTGDVACTVPMTAPSMGGCVTVMP